jgi:hypothetical protein
MVVELFRSGCEASDVFGMTSGMLTDTARSAKRFASFEAFVVALFRVEVFWVVTRKTSTSTTRFTTVFSVIP